MSNEVNSSEQSKKKPDWKKIEAIACGYLRIAGTWYKKCVHPVTKHEVLEHVRPEDIIKDYQYLGDKAGAMILGSAAKYINYVNMPDHLNYSESVESPTKDLYYNIYRPINHKPQEGGDFSHIDSLIHHIFGEQYEMGMDYVQLLYIQPTKRLPVLVLVSKENGTGKSTFCNFLHALFGENCVQITNETLRSNFNSTWVSKLLVYCEETLLDRREDSEKIKNLTTAENVPSEAKGKDRTMVQTYIKFILCSNDENRPVILTADDTRHWVRKVAVITDKNPNENFLEECKKEIPAFLHHLTQRKLTTSGTDRLWFRPEETRTRAWQRVVTGSIPKLDREIASMLIDIMEELQIKELKYDATSLLLAVKGTSIPADLRCSVSKTDIKNILRSWGLSASKKTERFDFYWMDGTGVLHEEKNKTGKCYLITKEILLKWIDE